jgi:hypothetical protein
VILSAISERIKADVHVTKKNIKREEAKPDGNPAPVRTRLQNLKVCLCSFVLFWCV